MKLVFVRWLGEMCLSLGIRHVLLREMRVRTIEENIGVLLRGSLDEKGLVELLVHLEKVGFAVQGGSAGPFFTTIH